MYCIIKGAMKVIDAVKLMEILIVVLVLYSGGVCKLQHFITSYYSVTSKITDTLEPATYFTVIKRLYYHGLLCFNLLQVRSYAAVFINLPISYAHTSHWYMTF